MCEANAYLVKEGREEILLDNVDVLETEGDLLIMTSLFGEKKEVRGRIKNISLVDHKILIEEL